MSLNIDTLDIEITSKCNLKCPYCYVGTGKHPCGDMSDEVIENTLDIVEKYGRTKPETLMKDGQKKQLKATQITFYGGEPLLSFERVERFVERSIKRGMRLEFSALSNGTTGTKEQVNWLKHFNIWTQRSIDGHPEAQEKNRPNSIEKYKEKNEIWQDYDHSRRMTIEPEFAKDLLKSMKFFEEMGFKMGISPMANYYTEWSEEHIEDFKKSLWDLARYYLERWHQKTPFYVYYFANEIMGRFAKQTKFGCGGTRGLHCVSWDGVVYMCHRFSKDPYDSDVCYGSLKQILDGTAKGYGPKLLKQTCKFQKNDPKDWLEMCRACETKGCEKGCVHTNWECTHTYDTPPKLYCEIRKETAKIVAWLDEQLRDIDRDWWKKGNTTSTKKQGGQCGIN